MFVIVKTRETEEGTFIGTEIPESFVPNNFPPFDDDKHLITNVLSWKNYKELRLKIPCPETKELKFLDGTDKSPGFQGRCSQALTRDCWAVCSAAAKRQAVLS